MESEPNTFYRLETSSNSGVIRWRPSRFLALQMLEKKLWSLKFFRSPEFSFNRCIKLTTGIVNGGPFWSLSILSGFSSRRGLHGAEAFSGI